MTVRKNEIPRKQSTWGGGKERSGTIIRATSAKSHLVTELVMCRSIGMLTGKKYLIPSHSASNHMLTNKQKNNHRNFYAQNKFKK